MSRKTTKQCHAFVVRYVETNMREVIIAAGSADEAVTLCNTHWHQTICPQVVEGGIFKPSVITREATADEAGRAIFVHGPPHDH